MSLNFFTEKKNTAYKESLAQTLDDSSGILLPQPSACLSPHLKVKSSPAHWEDCLWGRLVTVHTLLRTVLMEAEKRTQVYS